MSGKRFYITTAVVLSASALGACAHQFMAAAQNECAAFGYSPGTPEYASCVQQQYAAGRARWQQGVANAQGAFGQQSGVAAPASQYGVAYLRNSYISGMNRICEYDRMGNAEVITIAATQMCPISR